MLRTFRKGLEARYRIWCDEDGLSLVEVLIAMFVLSIAVLALASTAAATVTSLRVSRERQLATVAASAAIEEVRSYEYRDIAHPHDEVTPATDPDYVSGTAPYEFAHDDQNAEPLVVSADGRVSPHAWTSDDGRLMIRVFVTWYNDPSTATAHDARRITAIVRWDDPAGGEGEVRQSTLVAEAGRGLPQPRFHVSPSELMRHTPGLVCFTHSLRNIGATDRYDWQLFDSDGEPASVVNNWTLRAVADRWEAQIWFGTPDYDGSNKPNTAAPNLWRDETGNQRPDSPGEVEAGETQTITVCYTPSNHPQTNKAPTLSFVIRSAFDETVKTDPPIVNRIVWEPKVHVLFLHDPDNTQDHERELGEPYTMNEVAPIQVDDDDNTFDTLFNYDTDWDPDEMGGIWLPRGETGKDDGTEHTGIWTYNGLPVGTELMEGTLTIWSAWAGILDGEPTANGPLLRYGLALDVMRWTGAGFDAESVPITPNEFSYEHTALDWMPVSVSFEVVGEPLEIESSQDHLRLRIWCAGDGLLEPDCHLAYDTESYPSRLEMREPD
jgi:type II secretory pathway pseudopilin PulG